MLGGLIFLCISAACCGGDAAPAPRAPRVTPASDDGAVPATATATATVEELPAEGGAEKKQVAAAKAAKPQSPASGKKKKTKKAQD